MNDKLVLIFSALPAVLTSLVIITTLMMQDKISTNLGLLLILITMLVAFIPVILEYLISNRISLKMEKPKQQQQIPPKQIQMGPPPRPTIQHSAGIPKTTYQPEDMEDYAFMKNAGFI